MVCSLISTSFLPLIISQFTMAKARRWTLTTIRLEDYDPFNFDEEAAQKALGCKIQNISKGHHDHATLLLVFESQVTESVIRKRMPNGIESLVIYDGRKRKREDVVTVDCSTQTDVPVAVTGVIEKIKALKDRVAQLEEALQKAQDATDVNYIASFL